MNLLPIFFTESQEQGHLPESFDVEVIKFTFIPNVDTRSDRFHIPHYEMMKKLALSQRIMIFGHDADEYGQLIASIMYHIFKEMGVRDELMIRMPLTEKGIGMVSTFYSRKELDGFKSFYALDRLFMNSHRGLGIRKALMLRHLYHTSALPLHRVSNLNPNGTNTVTYVTKILLKEEDV